MHSYVGSGTILFELELPCDCLLGALIRNNILQNYLLEGLSGVAEYLHPVVNLLRAKTVSKYHTLVQRSLVVFFNYFTIVPIFGFSVADAKKERIKASSCLWLNQRPE